MKDTKIKICGITLPEDARVCQELGADYLGMVFAESPRRVSPERAKEIRCAVPRADLVGVFVNADPETIAEAVEFADLDMIQVHGNESPDYVRELFSYLSLPIIKGLHINESKDLEALQDFSSVRFFLFDLEKGTPCHVETVQKLWAGAGRAGRRGYTVFLAGGLDPSNVREALKQTAPYGVDVCRGVELSPGIKDRHAVKRFITEVRGCPSTKG